MAVNGNLPSVTELVPAETTALHDIGYGLFHLTPAERGPALNFLESVATAYLGPASMLTQNSSISNLLAEMTATTLPAVAVEASMYGAVGTTDEVIHLITEFLPGQVEHAINSGLDPLVYASEALGLAFAFSNETGGTAFATNFGPANSTMPSSTAGDAVFAQAAANTIFGPASTNNLTNAIDGWVSNWKAFYSSHGVPGIPDPSTTQIDLAARGAAWGDAVGVALANNLGPLKGEVMNFFLNAGTTVPDAAVHLTGIAAHAELLVA